MVSRGNLCLDDGLERLRKLGDDTNIGSTGTRKPGSTSDSGEPRSAGSLHDRDLRLGNDDHDRCGRRFSQLSGQPCFPAT